MPSFLRTKQFGFSALALLIISTVFFGQQSYQNRRYKIDRSTTSFIATSSVDSKFIKQTNKGFSYDRSDELKPGNKQLTVTSSDSATTSSLYKANLSYDLSNGVSFGDNKGNDDLIIKPTENLSAGRLEQGNIVYPASSTEKHIYSFKKNGLKEDILLTKPTTKVMQFSWSLTLSSEQEARQLPDGSIGIYTASSDFLSNVTAGDDKSRILIDKAKQNAPKDLLIYVMPKPYIIDSRGIKNYDDTSFSLKDNILTLEARNMLNKQYPLSIDPTVTVTTTADFRTGIDDGMLDYSTSGQITRNAVSIGTVGATTQQTNMFTTTRSESASVAYNGYLYIIGGCTSGTNICNSTLNDISYCPINSGGSIGTCTQQTSIFTNARAGHAAAVYNGYLYIIGGWTGSAGLNDITYCPLNGNGSVGTCVAQASLMPNATQYSEAVIYNGYIYIYSGNAITYIVRCQIYANGSVNTCIQQNSLVTTGRHHASLAVYNGFLYIIGGCNGGWCTNYQNDIQHCAINADSSLSTCVQQTNAFTTARFAHTSVAYDGYLYIAGGCSSGASCSTFERDIQHCPINSDGSVGTCVQQTNAFTTARAYHASVVYDGYFYIIGGCSAADPCSTFQNDIQRVQISTGSATFGPVGATTQQTSAFTTARFNHTSVVYNNYLYIIGGTDGTGTYFNDIQYCPINSNGSVGACTQQAGAFSTARYWHTSVAYNGYLYIIGGFGGSQQNDIQYCPINSNGSIGTCTQQINAFTTARNAHTSVAYNGYLYIIGGTNGSQQNDIQYCPINSNGSIGTCTQQAAAFTTARSQHSSVAYNGYLYIIGGWDGASPLSDIQYCPINSNGSIGTCTQQAAAFTTARYSFSSVTNNGYIYIVGGYDLVTVKNDVQYLPVQSPALISHYERNIDITSTTSRISSFVVNGTAKCSYTVAYKMADNTGIYGSVTTVFNVFPGISQTVSGGTNMRYILMVITLDDSSCGGTSNVTDIVITYNASPTAPTLLLPVSGSTGVSLNPEFRLGTTDGESDYLQYKIDVCSTSNCSSIVRTINQVSSQTGWLAQSQQSATAYKGNSASILENAIHQYQTPALSANTQYWWRGYAIDPGGSNNFSSASSISTFTTLTTIPKTVQFKGNLNIGGNVIIKP